MDEFAQASGIEWAGDVGTVRYGGGDDKNVVMFFNKPMHNPSKSREAGSPIYEDVIFVRIHPPGERLNIFEAPATPEHKRRFPMQWHQFQQHKQQTPSGTPVDLLYPDHPSVPAKLRAHNVYTIRKQLAELSGNAIDDIGMGAQTYSNDARKYLEAANKGVKASQMRAELDERDGQIRVLKQQVEHLMTTVTQLKNQGIANVTSARDFNQTVAGQSQRPVHLGEGFDPQTAQINAVAAQSVPRPRARRAKPSIG